MLGWLWLMRKAACAGGLLLLVKAALTYTDLGRRAMALIECSGPPCTNTSTSPNPYDLACCCS